jgi:hypothetical protein
MPNNCTLYFPDYNFLVVPTSGCWARPDFIEVVNRCILTKAIVALDGSEPIKSLGGLSGLVISASNGEGDSLNLLSETLTKLVNCIIANNGVNPSESPICAYVINTSTQQVLSHSSLYSNVFDFVYKTSIMTDKFNKDIEITRFEQQLANSSSFFEFVQKDILDPTDITFAYRYVIHVNEYYRLVIHVRLTPNTSYNPICQQESEPCISEHCNNDDDDESSSNESHLECSNIWQPL